MSRETSPCIDGDFWLDKRRDGAAADIWQIASYRGKSRSVVYRSTKQRDVEAAKPLLHAHASRERARRHQASESAKVVPQLFLYIEENENRIRNLAQSKSSMRMFIGFLIADKDEDPSRPGLDITFAELRPTVWKRFIDWRKGPHSYSVPWGDRIYNHTSKGVSGEAIQRNIDDVRAAMKHAIREDRVPSMPEVRSVDKRDRSPARDLRFTIKQLGAILAYAQEDIEAYRWVALMIATACRPEAGLAFQPSKQWQDDLLDLHPPEWPRTDKLNPVVRVIDGFEMILEDWLANPHIPAKSRKRWWRTMRRALDLDERAVAKTIRHTIATELRRRGVPGGEISGQLGHIDPEMHRTSSIYAKHDPAYLGKAAKALTKIWSEVQKAATQWTADHVRTRSFRGQPISVAKKSEKVLEKQDVEPGWGA